MDVFVSFLLHLCVCISECFFVVCFFITNFYSVYSRQVFVLFCSFFFYQYTTCYTTGAKHFGKESSRVLHDFCFWFTCLQQLKYSPLAFVYNFFLDVLALSKERMKETEAFFFIKIVTQKVRVCLLLVSSFPPSCGIHMCIVLVCLVVIEILRFCS